MQIQKGTVAKAVKDRTQAFPFIEVPAELRPYELKEAFEDARARGPQWDKCLKNTLYCMHKTAGFLAA